MRRGKALYVAAAMFALAFVLFVNSLYLLNSLLRDHDDIFSQYVRYSKEILPLVLTVLFTLFFAVLGLLALRRDKK